MFWQALLFAGQFILGEVTRQRPKRVSWEEFIDSNEPTEVRPIPYAGGTIELTPARQWYGDYKTRAVERDSHWTDYLFMGASAFLLDTITVAYRYYISEMFPLCFGPDRHVQRVTIEDRLMYQAALTFDNAGSGFLIDDPQAWGGDQPPGEGGQYSHCHVTRGNYVDATDIYLEQILATPPNKCPSLRGITTLISYGPNGPVEESGYFAAGGVGYTPRLKEWKVVVRGQPDNLTTGFNQIGRHMNPMETIYEWSTSLEYGARVPDVELNLSNWRECAETLFDEGNGWSGRIEGTTSPGEVVKDILAQIDAVPDFSPSLGLGFRLIRRDYSFGSLRVLDKSVITTIDEFTPGTYEDSVNKVNVEFPEDQENDFRPRKALYIDPANQQIQGGRVVPQTVGFLGVGDFEQANVIATRLGRAQSLPRAPLECSVFPSWGRLTYVGEVVLFEWSSPSLSIVMRVMKITPNGPDERDYRLVLMEDQFSTGLRTFGEPGESQHTDPAAGLSTAPPSATWNEAEFPPDGLRFDLITLNTNQFQATITGGIIFGSYAPGGQYARLYVTEPGGVQTLSPVRLVPDANNEATFSWPGMAAGEYEFCVQTFSLRDATNGVKVCAEIIVAAIGSPSASPSASVSPSSSVSASPSASASVSPSPSVSPSSSASPSSSLSPSASLSPSSSASPSGAPELDLALIDGCENVARPDDKWTIEGHSTAPVGSIPGMNGLCYDDAAFAGHTIAVPETGEFTATWKIRFRSLPVSSQVFALFFNAGANQPFALNLLPTGAVEATKSSGNDTSVASLIAIDTTYVFEFYGKVHPTDGAYRLKIDGVVPDKSGGGTMEASGTDTSTGSPDTIIRWRVGSGSTDTYADDHAFDQSGNDIGPGQVETLYPNGAGDLAELTRGGTDSGANWSQCDEAVGNGNTDYVVTTVNGATFKNQLRIGGVNYDGAVTHTAISGFDCYMEVWNTNPATSAAWTDSDIDGLQAGILGIDANQRDVYTFQNRSVSGTPRAVQVTTYVSLSSSRIRMTQAVLEVWVETP